MPLGPASCGFVGAGLGAMGCAGAEARVRIWYFGGRVLSRLREALLLSCRAANSIFPGSDGFV